MKPSTRGVPETNKKASSRVEFIDAGGATSSTEVGRGRQGIVAARPGVGGQSGCGCIHGGANDLVAALKSMAVDFYPNKKNPNKKKNKSTKKCDESIYYKFE